MKEKLYKYIKENLEIEEINYISFHEEIENNYECRKISPFYLKSVDNLEINEFVEQKNNYSDFQTLLFKMIDERNLKDMFTIKFTLIEDCFLKLEAILITTQAKKQLFYLAYH